MEPDPGFKESREGQPPTSEDGHAAESSHPVERRPNPPRESVVEEEEEEAGGPVKSFLEHLEDLRWTFIKSGSALVVATIICLVGAQGLFSFLTWPMRLAQVDVKLEWFSPTGGVMSTLKIAFYAGVVVGMPFILYFVGQFVVPALKSKEKKYFFTAFSIGTGFFIAGLITCYFVILPVSLSALVKYNNWVGISSATWRAEDYFNFVTKFMLGVGLLFEVPVLILTLVKVELIRPETLINGRRYMLVINFVLCAVLTPADVATTVIMALVLQLVYEGCVWVAKYWDRKKKQHLATEMGLGRPRSGQV